MTALPLVGEPAKLRFSLLEAQIADHCNLRCKACSHHSPYVAPNFYSLEQFTKDVRALSSVSVAGELRLVGGEPLLHPQVDDFLFAARESGVAEKYSVFTNGILLQRMTDRFFDLVDFVHLSNYPVTSPKRDAQEKLLLDRSRRFNVELHIQDTDSFYDIETEKLSDIEAQESFNGCKRRHDFPMIYSGLFYKCMRPPTTAGYLQNRGACQPLPDFASLDGVALDSPDLAQTLQRYMADKRALQSCSYCLFGYVVGYYEHHDNRVYTRVKDSLREVTRLRNFARYSPIGSRLFQILDPMLASVEKIPEPRVPIRAHVNMSREECAPRRTGVTLQG